MKKNICLAFLSIFFMSFPYCLQAQVDSAEYKEGLIESLMFESNYYKALFLYDKLNEQQRLLELIDKENIYIPKKDLYYAIFSEDSRNFIAFYALKYNKKDFTYDGAVYGYQFDLKKVNNVFYEESNFEGCYAWCIEGFKINESPFLTSYELNGTFLPNRPLEEAEKYYVITLLANSYFFYSGSQDPDPGFWERVNRK